MRKGISSLVLVGVVVALATGGLASAKPKATTKPIQDSIPFGAHVSIGCDVTHGVQTYVSDTRVSLAVVQNGCTEPDIQSRVKVRENAFRGVVLYELHHDANGTGAIMDIDAVPLSG